MAVRSLRVVLGVAEIERRESRHRAGDADGARRLERGEEGAHVGARGGELGARRRVGSQEALREADAADVEARRERDGAARRQHELGRAAADVDHEHIVQRRTTGGDAAKHHRRLLLAREKPGREPVAPLDLAEERLAVLRIAHRRGRDAERPLGAERLELLPIVGEAVAHACDGDREEDAALVDVLAEASDGEPACDLLQPAVLDVRDEEPGRVRPEVDRCDAASSASGRKTRSQRVRLRAVSIDSRSTSSRARETRSRSVAAWRSWLARSASARSCSVRADRSSNSASSSLNTRPVRLPCRQNARPRTMTTKRPTSENTSPRRNAVRITTPV